MTHFADAITERIHQLANPSVVGLDPRLEWLPSFLGKEPGPALLAWGKGIIDAVADVVPAIKPQIAFYECHGPEGLKAYAETIAYARKKDLLVIGDVKRGDIGSTAQAYAKAHLGPNSAFKADAVTVNPYLGSDGVKPFLEADENGGIFVLVRTSNPSSDELQSLSVGDELLDEHVAALVSVWGRESIGQSGFSRVGAVVGATYPEEARTLRALMPHQLFLVPGYGAQGGTAANVAPCFHKNGTGALISSSRGITEAWKAAKASERAYAEEARKAALAMKEDLRKALNF